MSIGSGAAAEATIARVKNAFGFLARHREYIALALLILIVTVISTAWNIHDTRPMPKNDAHGYLAKTFKFIDKIGKHGLSGLSGPVRGLSLQGRPPLYQLLSVPFIWLFGRSVDAAVSVNLLFQGLLLLSTYGIGRLAKNGRAGLLAALLVAAYPPILNLSRMYMPHYAVVACVALSLWLLLLLLKTRSVKVAWLFGGSLGFGALIRHYFPVFYLAVPTVIFGFYMLLFQTNPRRPPGLKETPAWLLAKLRDPFVLRGLLPAALIAVGLIAPWYLTRGRDLFPILETLGARPVVVAKGFSGVEPSFWWYALTISHVISNIFVILLGIGLVVGVIKRRVSASVLVVAFLGTYWAVSTQTHRAWVNFTPALPAAAALTACWVADVGHWAFPTRAGRSRTVQVTKADRCGGEVAVAHVDGAPLTVRLRADHGLWDSIEEGTSLRITLKVDADGKNSYMLRLAPQRRIGSLVSTALIVICVVLAAFTFSVATWGVQAWSRPIAIALGAPLDSETCSDRFELAFCPNPAMDEDWHVSDILQIIADDPECKDRECQLMVVSVTEEFDAIAFKYYLTQDFPESQISTTWLGGILADEPYNFNGVLQSDYVVYMTLRIGETCRERQRSLCTIRFLQSPPPVFADAHQEVASFELPQGRTAKSIKRIKPLTYEEAVLSVEAFNLPEPAKSQVLAELDDLSILD